VKLGVLYSAMGLLGVLFFLTVARLIVFTALWVSLGRSVWLLPNLYSDDVPISGILSPFIAEDKPKAKAGDDPNAVTSPPLIKRLAVAAAAALLLHALYRATPDGKGVVSNLKGANKSILEMLNLHDGPKSIAGGGGENATAAAVHAGPGLSASGAPVPPPTAATVAAAALQRGASGPTGLREREAAAKAAAEERLRNLAPIPEEEEVAEEGEGGAAAAAGEDEAAPAQAEEAHAGSDAAAAAEAHAPDAGAQATAAEL
jgi:hypothetical protein